MSGDALATRCRRTVFDAKPDRSFLIITVTRSAVAAAVATVLSAALVTTASADDTPSSDAGSTGSRSSSQTERDHPDRDPGSGGVGSGQEPHDGLSNDTTTVDHETVSDHSVGYGREPHDGLADDFFGESSADQMAHVFADLAEKRDALISGINLEGDEHSQNAQVMIDETLNEADKIRDQAQYEMAATLVLSSEVIMSYPATGQALGPNQLPGMHAASPKDVTGGSHPPGKQDSTLGPRPAPSSAGG